MLPISTTKRVRTKGADIGSASFPSDRPRPTVTGRSAFLSRELRAYADECTIIGVRPAMDPERHALTRLVWVCLVLAGIGLATYQIQDRICYFYRYPTATDVRIEQAHKLRFPQVTICNVNKMRKSVAHHLSK